MTGLLALMLLTDARWPSRAGPDGRITGDHRLHAVRGHLLEMAGDHTTALRCYRAAARRATSLPQRRYRQALRAARLAVE